MIHRIEGVTYGNLAEALRRAGFVEREKDDARTYTYPDSKAFIVYPRFPLTENVAWYHLMAARTTVDGFGIMDKGKFDTLVNEVTGVELPALSR